MVAAPGLSAEGADPTPSPGPVDGSAPGPEGRTPGPASRVPTLDIVLFAVVALWAILLRGDRPSTGVGHAGVHGATLTLALVVGTLALLRYRTHGRRAALLIGVGFLAEALLEALHLAFLTGERPGGTPATDALTVWSGSAAGTLLALFFVASWRASDGEGGRGRDRREILVYASGLGLAALAFAVLALAPPLPAFHPTWPLSRPEDLVPALLFGVAYVGHLRAGRWRREPFDRWLLSGLLLSTLLYALFITRAGKIGDPYLGVAHVLELISYALVLIGLLLELGVSFRHEEEVLKQVTDANQALAQEVAVRREAEAVLQRSEERLQNFLDNAHDLVQSTSPDGTILYVNAAWIRTLGYTPEDLRTLQLADILHPDDREACIASFRHVLAGAEVDRLTTRFLSKHGEIVVCSGSASRHVENGMPVSTQAIFRDVTDQKAAERELAASRANLAALVENTGDAIWSVDTDHRLVTFNSAFALVVEARSGREPGVGDPPEIVFGPDEASGYEELYARVLRGERFSELREETLEGRDRVVEIFCNPILEAEGPTGAVMFGKDVTRRQRAEGALRIAKDEAETANQAKSQFLANMSHELRTPLNSVIGFTNILLKNKRGHLNDQELGFLERVLANGKHLLTLINEVLDLSKIEAGRMDLHPEPVDLEDLLHEITQQLEGQAREKRVDLGAESPGEVEPLETDRARLKQVIINLVGNAVKFSAGGSVTVRIAVGPDGRTPSAIHVEDTGIGIPPDRLEAIFEAFQQADGSTSRRYGGTGLGLAISRSLCQLLGCDLTVRSTVGEGSVFTIELPPQTPGPD